MSFDLDEYFKSLSVMDSCKTDTSDALLVMLKNPNVNLVSISMSKEIYINPLEYQKDEDGYLVVEFQLDRNCDIINNCKLGNEPEKIKSLELIIGNKKMPLERSTLLNMVGSAHTNVYVRATMNTIVNKITFNYTCYFGQTQIRRSLVPRGNAVFKAGNIYYEEYKATIKDDL